MATELRAGSTAAPAFGLQGAAGALLYVALAAAFLAFLPGLSGGYLFDDFSNLGGLEILKNSPGADSFWQYLAHGIASPTGRPIALASFALQAHDWPMEPGAFIRVNLLLHLLNGCLLFWWLWLLVRCRGGSAAQQAAVPALATALWLLAPIQVTGVLYIVQRMTELSATFVFSGLVAYLIGRRLAAAGRERYGFLLMTAGLAWGAGIGTFAKENAALMPLLLLVMECTLLTELARPARWRLWSGVFLVLPSLALLAALSLKAVIGFDSYALRDFTLAERLMTEARVLFMYLHKMLLPWPSAIRLLYDDFGTSAGLLRPWTTAASLLGLVGVAAASWGWRRRMPYLAFGTGWFLGAHLLESTVLPLELVFEHRNYQASAGVWFAVAASLAALWSRLQRPLMRRIVAVAAVAYVLLVASVTLQIASLWGRPFEMAAWNADRQPDSRRGRIELLGVLLALGHNDDAAQIALDAARRWPDDPAFHLSLLRAACQAPAIELPATEEVASRVRATRVQVLTAVYLIDSITEQIELGRCGRIGPERLEPLVLAAFDNPKLLPQRQNVLLLYSRVLRLAQRPLEARAYFRQAIEVQPVMILLIQGVLDEVAAGRLDEARAYLERARHEPRISAMDRWSHRHDLERLEQLIDAVEARRGLP